MRATLAFAFAALLPNWAWGHGGQPRVVRLSFPPQLEGGYWAITDVQGLYAADADGFQWLCDDAVARNAVFQAVVLVADDTRHWLVATESGLFRTDDGGCNFTPCTGPVANQVPVGLWQNPEDRAEVLTSTQSPGDGNDLYRTEDGGLTWTPAGLSANGIAHDVLRSPARADRVYVVDTHSARRSDDGGRTFVDIALGPPALDVMPLEFRLLAGHPTHADEVWAIVRRFPETTVVRSQDAGETWVPLLTLADPPSGFAFDRDARRVLLTTEFDGTRRSEDGGDTWTPVPEVVPMLGCLTLQPGTNRLWGCSNVTFTGPWVIGHSDDFGATWTPALSSYTEVHRPWACDAQSATATACAGLCSGLPPGTPCAGPDAGVVPVVDAGQPVDDAGPPVSTPDAVVPERSPDAAVTPPIAAKKANAGACAALPGSSSSPALWPLWVGCLCAARRRSRK